MPRPAVLLAFAAAAVPVEFAAVGELPVADVTGQVIGGVPARPDQWRASFYSKAPESCTATLVGPGALLLAAHCLPDGARIVLSVDSRRYPGTCTRHPDYTDGCQPTDLALCRLDTPVPAVGGRAYEVVEPDPAGVAGVGAVTLAGRGCTEPGGAAAGEFRTARAVLDPAQPGGDGYLIVRDRSAICPGDSGGGAFVESEVGGRALVAVNSCVRFGLRPDEPHVSFLAPTSTPAAAAFLRDWSARTGEPICGISDDVADCRP